MPSKSTSPASARDRFWDRFISRLINQGVKPKACRWYVMRGEQYIRAYPDKRLAQHSADDINGFLENLGRIGRISDWQFRQCVAAIQNLFATAGMDPVAGVDWDFWRNSARTLPTTHSTIAREQPAMNDFDEQSVSGKVFKEKRNAPSLLDSIRKDHASVIEKLTTEIRRRNYSIRTEQAYEAWVCRFIAFCGNKDPIHLGAKEVVSFLEELAVKGNVSASTQNQALNALVFLYRQVLNQPLDELDGFTRTKRPKHLPVVLDKVEVGRLLQGLEGMHYLMAALLYGTGMRLMECVRLRVQDVDFHYRQLVVRCGKGQKDRVVPLPQCLELPLREQLARACELHREDLKKGFGEVFLPDAPARKWPNACREWRWQYVFPSGRLSVIRAAVRPAVIIFMRMACKNP